MKDALILMFFIGFQASCATNLEEPTSWEEQVKMEDSKLDLPKFIGSLSQQSPKKLTGKKLWYKERLKTDNRWENQFKLALILVSMESPSDADLKQAKRLLDDVIRLVDDQDEVGVWAIWIRSIVETQQGLIAQLMREKVANKDLNDKLQALSSIEKKLEKRTRQ